MKVNISGSRLFNVNTFLHKPLYNIRFLVYTAAALGLVLFPPTTVLERTMPPNDMHEFLGRTQGFYDTQCRQISKAPKISFRKPKHIAQNIKLTFTVCSFWNRVGCGTHHRFNVAQRCVRNLGGPVTACPLHPMIESAVTSILIIMNIQLNDRDYDDHN